MASLLPWIIAALLIAFLVINSRTIRHGGTTGDFPVFYEAGLAMHDGRNIYLKPEDAGEYIYPPPLAWVFSLISPTGQASSAWIWGVCSAAMLSASLVVGASSIARRFDLKPTLSAAGTVALLALLLDIDKTKSVFSGGQTDLVTVVGVTLAMAWHQKRPALAGLFLALAGIVKYVPLAFVGLLLVRRRFKAACWSVVFVVLLALAPALTVGWTQNLRLWSIALNGVARLFGGRGGEGITVNTMDASHTLSISVTSAISRWLTPEPGKAAALGVSGFVALLVLGLTWWRYATAGVSLFNRPANHDADPRAAAREAVLSPVEWAGGVVALLVFSPHSQGRHFVLLLPFYLVCVGLLLRPSARPAVRKAKRLLVASLVLFLAAMSLPPGSERFYDAQMWWRSVGGASWCLLPAWFALLHLALRTTESHPSPEVDEPTLTADRTASPAPRS